jgi:hypothetical protein
MRLNMEGRRSVSSAWVAGDQEFAQDLRQSGFGRRRRQALDAEVDGDQPESRLPR